MRFMGPYDTTGAWQWWTGNAAGCSGATTCASATYNSCSSYTNAASLCYLNDTIATWTPQTRSDTAIVSPDKRINVIKPSCLGGPSTVNCGPQKGSLAQVNNGLYFGRYRCDGTATSAVPATSTALGTWSTSNYIFIRLPNGIAPDGGANNGEGPVITTAQSCGYSSSGAPFQNIVYTDMSLEEMWFLLAEAYVRTGNAAGAVGIVNATRVGVGGLPPITAAGVPAGAGCIPRNEDGTCANLMMSLFYEERLELMGDNELTLWSQWRAAGKLLQGSMIQMPPEARELFSLGLIPGGSSVGYSYGQLLPGSSYVSCTGIIPEGANVAGCTGIYP
jgi:hypothetical protein